MTSSGPFSWPLIYLRGDNVTILKRIEKRSGVQPAVRDLLLSLSVVEKEKPQHAASPADTETVADNDYTITAPLGVDFNGYQFTLISSDEADDEVVIEETNDQKYNITAGDNATNSDVEAALEEYFGGNWTVTADDGQTGSDFGGEELTLEGGEVATIAAKGELRFDDDNLYIANDDVELLSESGWKEISLSSLS